MRCPTLPFIVSVWLFSPAFLRAVPSGSEIVAGPYKLTAVREVQAGVPKGREEKVVLPPSHIFAGADHDCWVYVPSQCEAAKPAGVMIFQDGGGEVNREGGWRVPVGVFINPG